MTAAPPPTGRSMRRPHAPADIDGPNFRNGVDGSRPGRGKRLEEMKDHLIFQRCLPPLICMITDHHHPHYAGSSSFSQTVQNFPAKPAPSFHKHHPITPSHFREAGICFGHAEIEASQWQVMNAGESISQSTSVSTIYLSVGHRAAFELASKRTHL